MKKIKSISFIFLLFIIYIYTAYITLLPNNVIIFEGENVNIRTILGIKINKDDMVANNMQALEASKSITESQGFNYGKTKVSVNLFDLIPLKQVEVNVLKKTKVVPLGNTIGLKLYTKGVMVIGMAEIQGEDKQNYKPYENSGIEEGDMIISVDNKEVTCISDLIENVNQSNGNDICVEYLRENKTNTTNIKPIKSGNNEYKLGLWVRDAGGGVGTVTYYEPESGMFCALGHGITDVDTGEIVNISNGELVLAEINSINKGKRGSPGEIKGSIESTEKIGDVSKNTNLGVFGSITNKSKLEIKEDDAIEIASRDEIQEGKAEIICELEKGKKEKYEIQIQKIYSNNNYDNKSMIIKITDERLLEKTGGIIQGMSGSPIIQNGKFVGAVTHVLVNDPTTGYGIFADMLIKQMKLS